MEQKEYQRTLPDLIKEKRTLHKAITLYALMVIMVIFLFSIGAAQGLLLWNTSVFVGSLVMIGITLFYGRRTLATALHISREKDAFDIFHTWLLEKERDSPNSFFVYAPLVFTPDQVLTQYGKEKYMTTFTAAYFRNLGKRIRFIQHIQERHGERVFSVNTVNIDELLYIVEAGLERLIQPVVSGSIKMTYFGFFGTVLGIILIAVNIQFGETAAESLKIASSLIVGIGVAAVTTAFGIVGRLVLGAFAEQYQEISGRLVAELLRLTSVNGLDLFAATQHADVEQFLVDAAESKELAQNNSADTVTS